MSLFKNTSGQKVRVYAFDATTGLPKTGDAANITASVSKDFGAFADLTDTSAAEEDSTKAKGYYLFDISQAECNADDVAIAGRSSTSNIVVVGAPARMATRPPNAGVLAITAAGKVTATLTAADVSGNVPADFQALKGTALTEGAAGRLKAAFTTLFDVASPVFTTASVNQTGDSYARIGANGTSLTALATAAQINSLQVNTRANISVPVEIETPDSSTLVYKIRLHLFDTEGNMEAPDSTPTVTLTNAAGTDRSSRLSAASNPSAGVYTWDYTATAGDAEEQLVWVFSVVEGSLTRTYPATSYVVEETAYRFSSTDRSNLGAIKAKTDLLNYTGSGASALAKVDVRDWNGSAVAVPNSTGVPLVDVVGVMGSSASGLDTFAANYGSGELAVDINGTVATVTTVNGLAAGVITAASIAADAITAAKIAAGAITSSECPTLANLDAAVSGRASQASVDAVAGYVDTEVALLLKLVQADKVVDTGVTPWALVWYEKGTATELLRQRLFSAAGANVTGTDTVVGRAKQ